MCGIVVSDIDHLLVHVVYRFDEDLDAGIGAGRNVGVPHLSQLGRGVDGNIDHAMGRPIESDGADEGQATCRTVEEVDLLEKATCSKRTGIGSLISPRDDHPARLLLESECLELLESVDEVVLEGIRVHLVQLAIRNTIFEGLSIGSHIPPSRQAEDSSFSGTSQVEDLIREQPSHAILGRSEHTSNLSVVKGTVAGWQGSPHRLQRQSGDNPKHSQVILEKQESVGLIGSLVDQIAGKSLPGARNVLPLPRLINDGVLVEIGGHAAIEEDQSEGSGVGALTDFQSLQSIGSSHEGIIGGLDETDDLTHIHIRSRGVAHGLPEDASGQQAEQDQQEGVPAP
jgi:hypothetical protein